MSNIKERPDTYKREVREDALERKISESEAYRMIIDVYIMIMITIAHHFPQTPDLIRGRCIKRRGQGKCTRKDDSQRPAGQ